MMINKGSKIYRDKVYDIDEVTNPKVKQLINKIDRLKTELTDAENQLYNIQSNCEHKLYLTTKCVYSDTFTCSKCNYKYTK